MSTFDGGDWLYLCYRYMDKFHCEPVEWLDLFDYMSYMEVEGKIGDFLKSLRNKEQ